MKAAKQALGCGFCGGALTGRRTKFCSRLCMQGRKPPVRFETNCAECNSRFMQRHTGQEFCARTCTKRHQDRIRTKARRARVLDGEKVNPVEVFARDGWRCQLCHLRTPRKLMGTTEPRAPTLDHIIPISKGGPHTYRNTQCACWDCNTRVKRARELGQLRLF